MAARRTRPVIVGVAGGSGSGKSTVVRTVGRALGRRRVSVLHHDAYYHDLAHLPPDRRASVNFDHPDSLETGLMVDHVEALAAARPVETPVYDFSTHTRTDRTRSVKPTPVLILDGILVLSDPDLRALMDLRIYVDTAADLRLTRRIRRDTRDRGRTPEAVVEQYERTVRPMHERFVEPSKRHADLVVPEGGHNRVAVDRVIRRIQSLLAARRPTPPRTLERAGAGGGRGGPDDPYEGSAGRRDEGT